MLDKKGTTKSEIDQGTSSSEIHNYENQMSALFVDSKVEDKVEGIAKASTAYLTILRRAHKKQLRRTLNIYSRKIKTICIDLNANNIASMLEQIEHASLTANWDHINQLMTDFEALIKDLYETIFL